MDELDRDGRVAELTLEHRELAARVEHLDAVISGMADVPRLRPDAAAMLDKYRRNLTKLEFERDTIERELIALGRDSSDDFLVALLPDQAVRQP